MNKRPNVGGSMSNSGRGVEESRRIINAYPDESDMEYARSVEKSIRQRSRPKVPSFSPSLAAAMLSLPWPTNKKDAKGGEKAVETLVTNEPYEISDVEFPPALSQNPSGIQSSHSKKLPAKKQKSKSKTFYYPPDPKPKVSSTDREYRPITIPKFREVHTDWPGFAHEPISDWQTKYMIAKPYPKKGEEQTQNRSYTLFKGKAILSQVSSTNNNTNNNVPYESSDEEDKNAEKDAKVRKSKPKSKKGKDGSKSKPKPKRRLHVERVGSCIQ